ncbi:MAG: SUMF1/EgtB/PvdO family nonheme iron enzyme [Pseudomonadota bacterium]
MASIFVSHASGDDSEVDHLSEWLTSKGFEDHFVDHRHISGGSSWNEVLPQESAAAQILIALVTESWLKSDECYSEYRAAYYGKKGVIPLLLAHRLEDLPGREKERFVTLTASVQGIQISGLPPDGMTETLIQGSLSAARETIKRRRRARIVRQVSFSLGTIVILFAGTALYFKDYLAAFVEKQQIAQSFAPIDESDLRNRFVNAADLPLEERTFRECDTPSACPDMIAVPAGNFTMGAVDDFGAEPEELPPTPIQIERAFAVSVSEITEAQWRTCHLSTRIGSGPKCKETPSWRKEGGRYPVDSVSWNDAQAYVSWLNAQIVGTPDGPYRLLSEAEWEYSARGAGTTIYAWGDNLLPGVCDHANALNVVMPGNFVIPRRGVDCPNNAVLKAQTRSLNANEFGLYDMAGNMAEWVQDCWHDDYGGRPRDQRAWQSAADRNCDRVIRGGSWFGLIDNLRPTARVKLGADLFGFNVGFRVARDLTWSSDP